MPELSESQAILDLASCKNSKKIMVECNSSTCAAVWASNNYSTAGTKTGDWCLPAAGVFVSFDEKSTIISKGFKAAGGSVGINDSISSSSEADDKNKWYGRLSYGLSRGGKSLSSMVRPVIGFCKAGYGYDKSTDSCKSCGSSYKYTCTGSGYSGGSGTACGGKYTACSCKSGYSWNGSVCKANSCPGYSDPFYCKSDAIDYNDWCLSGSDKLYSCSACNGPEAGFGEGQWCGSVCISASDICLGWEPEIPGEID